MSGYIPLVDRMQSSLFPEAVENYVEADSLVRVVDAFVDALDVAALGFARATPADEGRPGYDPRVLLKLFIYGYLNRVRSSRRLERETHRNVELVWLLRFARPDHKTISDFRAAHAKALKGVLREFVSLCQRLDLVGAETVGIDGSKFRAVNAKAQSFTPRELRRHLARIDAQVKDYLATVAAADHAADAQQLPSAVVVPDLAGKLAQLEARRAEYQQMLAQLDASGATQVTLTDPESRRMKVKQGTEVCYNAQIAVDAKAHLIVTTAVTNEVTDVQQLAPMATAVQAALGVPALAVTADKGYHNAAGLAQCVDAGITPTVPKPSATTRAASEGFAKERFAYVAEQDVYRCPVGAELPFQFERDEAGEQHRYYFNNAVCVDCPLRAQCTTQKDRSQGRRIKRWAREAVVEAVADRVRGNRAAMVQRKSLVEHPFGTIKRWDDGSYFLLRGLEKVDGEFSLMALAYNIRRAINMLGVPRLLDALGQRRAPSVALA